MDESNNVLVEDTENERTVAVYEWVEAAIFALVCVVLVFTFLFRIVGVDGESMQTTLMDHDRLILTRLNYTPADGHFVCHCFTHSGVITTLDSCSAFLPACITSSVGFQRSGSRGAGSGGARFALRGMHYWQAVWRHWCCFRHLWDFPLQNPCRAIHSRP